MNNARTILYYRNTKPQVEYIRTRRGIVCFSERKIDRFSVCFGDDDKHLILINKYMYNCCIYIITLYIGSVERLANINKYKTERTQHYIGVRAGIFLDVYKILLYEKYLCYLYINQCVYFLRTELY